MPFDKRQYMREYYQRNKDKWKEYAKGITPTIARIIRYGEYSKAKAADVMKNDLRRYVRRVDKNGNNVYLHVPYYGVKEARDREELNASQRAAFQGEYGRAKAKEMGSKPGAKRSFKKGPVSNMFDKQAYMREYYQRNKDKWERYNRDSRQGSYARAKMNEMNPNYASVSKRTNAVNRAHRDAYNQMLSRNSGINSGLASQAKARSIENKYLVNKEGSKTRANRYQQGEAKRIRSEYAHKGDVARQTGEARLRSKAAADQRRQNDKAKKNNRVKTLVENYMSNLKRAKDVNNFAQGWNPFAGGRTMHTKSKLAGKNAQKKAKFLTSNRALGETAKKTDSITSKSYGKRARGTIGYTPEYSKMVGQISKKAISKYNRRNNKEKVDRAFNEFRKYLKGTGLKYNGR